MRRTSCIARRKSWAAFGATQYSICTMMGPSSRCLSISNFGTETCQGLRFSFDLSIGNRNPALELWQHDRAHDSAKADTAEEQPVPERAKMQLVADDHRQQGPQCADEKDKEEGANQHYIMSLFQMHATERQIRQG